MVQTAVEWFYKELKNLIKKSELTDMKPSEFDTKERELIEQAKEMEKQQITDAFNDGNWVGRCAIVDDNLINKTVEKSAQTYYNETFKSE